MKQHVLVVNVSSYTRLITAAGEIMYTIRQVSATRVKRATTSHSDSTYRSSNDTTLVKKRNEVLLRHIVSVEDTLLLFLSSNGETAQIMTSFIPD